MGIGCCRWTDVQRLEAKKQGFGYRAALFARLVRTSEGVDINIHLDCFLCIARISLHFDKHVQTEFILDMLVDLILVKFVFSEVSAVRI